MQICTYSIRSALPVTEGYACGLELLTIYEAKGKISQHKAWQSSSEFLHSMRIVQCREALSSTFLALHATQKERERDFPESLELFILSSGDWQRLRRVVGGRAQTGRRLKRFPSFGLWWPTDLLHSLPLPLTSKKEESLFPFLSLCRSLSRFLFLSLLSWMT